MFDWFWEFLYMLSAGILYIIDLLMECANVLCGITPISVEGESTDLLSYIIKSEDVRLGFSVAAILGFIVLIFFTVFAVIRAITKEKAEATPAQVLVKAGKLALLFMFIPAIMLTLVWAGSVFMNALYQATTGGSTGGLGNYLFTCFAQDAGLSESEREIFIVAENYTGSSSYAYLDFDLVDECIDVSDYSFIMSWLAGILIVYGVGTGLVSFIDRLISIIVLYIISPFSVSSAVIDDGQRFKLWREQILIKFFNAFGMILYVNVYCIIIGLIIKDSVQLFGSGFLNQFAKILIIVGGGLSLPRAMALIGNIISAGAGSRELMDQAATSARLGGFARGVASAATFPVRGLASYANRRLGITDAMAGWFGMSSGQQAARAEVKREDAKNEILKKREDDKKSKDLKDKLNNGGNNNGNNGNNPINNANNNANNNNGNNNNNNLNNNINNQRGNQINNALNNNQNNNQNNDNALLPPDDDDDDDLR